MAKPQTAPKGAKFAEQMQDLGDASIAQQEVGAIRIVSQHRPEAGVQAVLVTQVDPSPYQPVGRPSRAAVDAVRQALAVVTSLEALVRPADEKDSPAWEALSEEARALATLAADIAANGIDQPLEVRTRADRFEVLSGHRRLEAARLAGLGEVPVTVRPVGSESEAALVVFRRNALREDFTAWQKATRTVELRAMRAKEREAQGQKPETQRELAVAFGEKLGPLNERLQVAEGLTPLLELIGQGDRTAGEELLSSLGHDFLIETVRKVKDPVGRVQAIHARIASRSSRNGPRKPDPVSGEGLVAPATQKGHTLKSSKDGVTLTIHFPIRDLTLVQAEALRADLEKLGKELDRRLRALQRQVAR